MTNLRIRPEKTGKEVLDLILAGIKADVSFNAFCLAEFGQANTLYLGFDPQNPPKEANIPWVSVVETGILVSDGYDAYNYEVSVGGAFTAEAKPTVNAVTGVIEYDGTEVADKFARLLYAAVLNATIANANNQVIEVLNSTPVSITSNLPHITVGFDLTISVNLMIET